ncbi:SpoIIE family protein phosphatase [Streptomyces sp. NPDC004237]|uniref:SpoIIE family protein phosphatase n=1 Tax=Streptomyces sp. NPDC004237 TaxID=3154455 RepID=UPI0033AD4803
MDVRSAMEAPGDAGAAGVLTATGEVSAWEPGGLDLLGFKSADALGRSFWELFADPVPEALAQCWADRMAWSGGAVLTRRDGSALRVLLRVRPLLDNSGNGVWTVAVESDPQDLAGSADMPDSALLKQWTLEQLPFPMSVFDRNGMRVAVNAAMTGAPERFAPEVLWPPTGEIGPPHPVANPAAIGEAAERVLRSAETVTLEVYDRDPELDGPRAWLVSLHPIKNPAGRIEGLAVAAIDSTEQYRGRHRLGLLNDASERIGTTLDLARTAEELAQVYIDQFADFVVVEILDSVLSGEEARPSHDGQLLFRRVAQRSVLPGCPESVVQVGAPLSYHVRSPTGRALAIGRPLLDRVDATTLKEWAAGSPERAAALKRYGFHSVLTVPLRARGLTLGVANLWRHRTPEPFDEDDLRLAEELASRAAVCVDNARRYARERATALALQRTLLPEQAPRQVGIAVEVASRYLPAEPEIGIGGDWFDVIPLSGMRVGLVVGDVVGHGIQASATMGRLCTAVRTLADVDLPPDELLTQLDDLVLRLDRDATEREARASEPALAEVGATCLYAVYDPVSRRCTMARAGHPVPVLRTPGGDTRFLDVPAGPPLGVGGLPFEVAEFDLPEGSVLAFYTDGLLEGAATDADAEHAAFHEGFSAPAPTLQDTCDTLLRRLLPERRTDDAALLLARTKTLDSSRVASWQPEADPEAVARARKWVTGTLTAWDLPELVFVVELVVSELVTNAIRYGRQPLLIRLIRGTSLICEVSDASSAAPHLRRARTFDEGGRGLFIVAQLTERWGSRPTPTGKTLWAEIPLSESVARN